MSSHIQVADRADRNGVDGEAPRVLLVTTLRAALAGDGAYLLRTNCTETDPVKLWRWYIQLQQAEAAFRT